MYNGIIRKIDEVGRIVIPKQIRKELGVLEPYCEIEMFCDGKQIICRKAEAACIFCDAKTELVEHEGKHICSTCLENLKTK